MPRHVLYLPRRKGLPYGAPPPLIGYVGYRCQRYLPSADLRSSRSPNWSVVIITLSIMYSDTYELSPEDTNNHPKSFALSPLFPRLLEGPMVSHQTRYIPTLAIPHLLVPRVDHLIGHRDSTTRVPRSLSFLLYPRVLECGLHSLLFIVFPARAYLLLWHRGIARGRHTALRSSGISQPNSP